MELRTERLLLRPVTTGDAEMIQVYRGDPLVVRYLPHPPRDREGVRQLLARAATLWSSIDEERFNLLFAVVLDGIVIGDVHAWNVAEPLQPSSTDPADVWIGFAFDPRHQGRGYASEAVRSLVDWLFARGVRTVFANCYLENTPSIGLLERLGFEEDVRFTTEEDACGKHAPSCRMRLQVVVVIRPSRPDDGVAIRDIERLAGARFREVGLDSVADDEPVPLASLTEYSVAGRAWVAVDDADQPLGYVLVDDVDGNAHVEQVSVLPDHQGRGVGRALLDRIRAWALETGRPAMTLTTFSDVPWNAPLYEHLGFEVLQEAEIGAQLRAVRDVEAGHGLDPQLRVCMRLSLGG